MNIVADRPTEGQFIAVWTFNDLIWSDTFKWEGSILLRFEETEANEDDSFWLDDSENFPYENQTEVVYITK